MGDSLFSEALGSGAHSNLSVNVPGGEKFPRVYPKCLEFRSPAFSFSELNLAGFLSSLVSDPEKGFFRAGTPVAHILFEGRTIGDDFQDIAGLHLHRQDGNLEGRLGAFEPAGVELLIGHY